MPGLRQRIGRLSFVLAVATLLMGSGCYYAALQTADTLPPGKVQLGLRMGAGYMYYHPESLLMLIPTELGLSARVGLARRLDVGIVFWPLLNGLVDVKYQFRDGPLRLAADLGFSSGVPIDMGFDSHDRVFTMNFCPAFIACGEHWYAGTRLIYTRSRHIDSHRTGVNWRQGIFAGGSFGRRFRLLPELDLYVPLKQSWDKIPSSIVAGVASGLQFRL
jgi:hypothetical protein